MTNKPYLGLSELVSMIDEPNRDICRKILESNKALFQKVQGASHNHQAWPGGYWDHVQETMNLAVAFYDTLDALRPLPFTRSDALLVLFLHDIEKPWKYELLPDGTLAIIEELREKKAQHAFRAEKLKEYGIALTPEQFNGLEYVEGEFEDYSSKRRVSGPLAAFCGNCDRTSARLWHDHPAAENDPWSGAKRISG